MLSVQLVSCLSRRMVHCKKRISPAIARMLINRCRNSTTTSSSLFSTSSVCRSEAAIAAPHIQDTDKEYSPKIHKLVGEIGSLTLLEVADLNELLKKTLNIQEAPMMAMQPSAAAGPAEAEEEAVPVAPKQTLFTVKLLKFDATKKVALIKEIKAQVSGFNLVQAKKFVESAPQPIRTDISKDEADKLKASLEAVGGEVEIE